MTFPERGLRFSGQVVHGEGLGEKMGYPTANLPSELIARYRISAGLYAVWASIDGGSRLPAILIVGTPYKLKGTGTKLEVYLLDYKKDLRGKGLAVEIVEYLRPVLEFLDVQALTAQIKIDIIQAKKILGVI